MESSSSTERFTLRGPSAELDPRYDAYRGDLADVALASRLFAPHYARPVDRRTGTEGAILHEKADASSETLGELAPGEAFALLDVSGSWGWGYRLSDHLVGYVLAASLEDAD